MLEVHVISFQNQILGNPNITPPKGEIIIKGVSIVQNISYCKDILEVLMNCMINWCAYYHIV